MRRATYRRRFVVVATSVLAVVVTAMAGPVRLAPFASASSPTPQDRASASSDSSASCPWVGSSAAVDQRVDQVLSRMTLSDKIAMVHGVEPSDGYGGYQPGIPALCIPALKFQDGPAGVADGMTGVTALPAPVAGAATWDRNLMHQYGQLMGAEAKGKGVNVLFGPMVNIARDPRWGRSWETFGEDPYLEGAMGVSTTEGIQSQNVIATVKHFDAYDQEQNGRGNSIVSERALNEIYRPAFWTTMQQGGAGAVMVTGGDVNNLPANENPDMLNTIERRWGFQGFVTSDYDGARSAAGSANAGLDLSMPSAGNFGTPLEQALQSGQVSMSRLNTMVSSLLREEFRFGLFEHPDTGSRSDPVTSPAHVALARSVAEQSTVLLKNNDQQLPLNAKTVGSVAVIGEAGSAQPKTVGCGSGQVTPPYQDTPLQGIQDRVGPSVPVSYSDGTSIPQAVQAAQSAKVAVVVAKDLECEGGGAAYGPGSPPPGSFDDRPSIELSDNQDQLIEAVAQANPHTVVVLDTGAPVAAPWLSKVPALVQAWYPGQEDGNALAAVLFGDVDPSGHLPQTWPVSDQQMPTSDPARWPGVGPSQQFSDGLLVGYRWYDANNVTPLFPFGYGLSYTNFSYSHLQVRTGQVQNQTSGPAPTVCACNGQGKGLVTVSAQVTNTGPVGGASVAQLYLGDPAAAGEPPRQLKGFDKVFLQPGQSKTVTFTLTGHDLSYWDDAANGWVVPDGKYQVYVGDSSALTDLPLHGGFAVTRSVGARYATAKAPSTVAPLSAFTVTADFVNNGDFPMNHTRFGVRTPAGWSVSGSGDAPSKLAAGQSVTESFQVTAPLSAQDTNPTLMPTVTFQQPGVDEPSQVATPVAVAVKPAVTVTASPVAVNQGQSGTTTLTFTSNLSQPAQVTVTASPPSGITVTPATTTVTVPSEGTTATVQVSVAPDATVGANQVPLIASLQNAGHSYPLPPAAIQVNVPFPSLAAAFNNVGITDDSATSVGNFDGSRNSYSAEALAAVGITPGAEITHDGATFTWPDVAAGTADNVQVAGQTIELHGSGSNLAFLLGGTHGTSTGTGTITYTDGSTQPFTLVADNWTIAPAGSPGPFSANGGDDILAVSAHWNPTNSPNGNWDVAVYGYTVPINPAKTVASVTLPATLGGGDGSGQQTAHVFAMATSS